MRNECSRVMASLIPASYGALMQRFHHLCQDAAELQTLIRIECRPFVGVRWNSEEEEQAEKVLERARDGSARDAPAMHRVQQESHLSALGRALSDHLRLVQADAPEANACATRNKQTC